MNVSSPRWSPSKVAMAKLAIDMLSSLSDGAGPSGTQHCSTQEVLVPNESRDNKGKVRDQGCI